MERFSVINGIHLETGTPLFEVIEDDGYYTHCGWYEHEDEAQAAVQRMQNEYEARSND